MSYWVTSAVLFCFTTIFLQFKGYSNYEIGIVFAVGNIIGFIAQPLIAGLVDKSQKRILLRCICITSILSALLMLAVCLLPSGSVTIMGAYALLIAGSTLLNPLCYRSAFMLEAMGAREFQPCAGNRLVFVCGMQRSYGNSRSTGQRKRRSGVIHNIFCSSRTYNASFYPRAACASLG